MSLLYNRGMKQFKHIEHVIPKLERVTSPDGSRLYQTPSGRAYPSVTTVTGLLSKASIMAWRKRVGEAEANRISSKAAGRGTRVHSLCEDFLSNKEVLPDIFDQELWNGYRPLLERIDNIHALETPLYSDHLEVAGTVDCIAEFDGKVSVIDFKTSKRIKSRDDIHGYFMQCSAYAVAFEERTGVPVSRLVILMAVDDENPLVFVEKRDTWVSEFLKLREDYRKWKNI
jgi:ATP-dependent exoDNAse (exonuclease V) beta subunit